VKGAKCFRIKKQIKSFAFNPEI